MNSLAAPFQEEDGKQNLVVLTEGDWRRGKKTHEYGNALDEKTRGAAAHDGVRKSQPQALGGTISQLHATQKH
jgi:hypothetical protein